MTELVFEIWRDSDGGSFEMGQVSEQADQLRKSLSPDAVCIHTFAACSNFEAFQKNYDWHGWGEWKRPENLDEHFFTEQEAEKQRLYLATRATGHERS